MAEAKANPNLRLIWFGHLNAPIVFTALGLSGVIKPTANPTDFPLLPIFAVAAVGFGVAATIVRGRIVDSGPATTSEDSAARMRRTIAPWALDAWIAVLGYVLMFLGYPPIQWIPFCAATVAMVFLHAPRDDA